VFALDAFRPSPGASVEVPEESSVGTTLTDLVGPDLEADQRNTDVAKIAGTIARRNIHASADGDGQLAIVAAYAGAFIECLPRRLGRTRILIAEGNMAVNVVADRLDALPSESRCLQAFSDEFTDFGTGNLWQRKMSEHEQGTAMPDQVSVLFLHACRGSADCDLSSTGDGRLHDCTSQGADLSVGRRRPFPGRRAA
jgi:hypothetical protein